MCAQSSLLTVVQGHGGQERESKRQASCKGTAHPKRWGRTKRSLASLVSEGPIVKGRGVLGRANCMLGWVEEPMCVHVCMLGRFSQVQLSATLGTIPLSMGFSRQEYWSEWPYPPPGDLPNPGIKPSLLHFLHWQVESLPQPGNAMNPQDMRDTTKHFSYIIAFNWHTDHHVIGEHHSYMSPFAKKQTE